MNLVYNIYVPAKFINNVILSNFDLAISLCCEIEHAFCTQNLISAFSVQLDNFIFVNFYILY